MDSFGLNDPRNQCRVFVLAIFCQFPRKWPKRKRERDRNNEPDISESCTVLLIGVSCGMKVRNGRRRNALQHWKVATPSLVQIQSQPPTGGLERKKNQTTTTKYRSKRSHNHQPRCNKRNEIYYHLTGGKMLINKTISLALELDFERVISAIIQFTGACVKVTPDRWEIGWGGERKRRRWPCCSCLFVFVFDFH